MSALPNEPLTMTESEYIEFSAQSELKYEFLDGEVFAMAGASREHDLICVRLSYLLYGHLRKGNCEVHSSDMRIKVLATALYTYPDLSVTCGNVLFTEDSIDTITNPQILFEVLSPSTEAYDRGKKFQNYRQIVSLQAYVMISQSSHHVEMYTRHEEKWVLSEAKGLEANIDIPQIQYRLSLAELYEGINLSS